MRGKIWLNIIVINKKNMYYSHHIFGEDNYLYILIIKVDKNIDFNIDESRFVVLNVFVRAC